MPLPSKPPPPLPSRRWGRHRIHLRPIGGRRLHRRLFLTRLPYPRFPRLRPLSRRTLRSAAPRRRRRPRFLIRALHVRPHRHRFLSTGCTQACPLPRLVLSAGATSVAPPLGYDASCVLLGSSDPSASPSTSTASSRSGSPPPLSSIRKEEEEQMMGKMHPISASDCPRLKYFEAMQRGKSKFNLLQRGKIGVAGSRVCKCSKKVRRRKQIRVQDRRREEV